MRALMVFLLMIPVVAQASTANLCESQMMAPEERLSRIVQTYRDLLTGRAASSLTNQEMTTLSHATSWDAFFSFQSDGTQERAAWIENMRFMENAVFDSIDAGINEAELVANLREAIADHFAALSSESELMRETEERRREVPIYLRKVDANWSRQLELVPGKPWVVMGGFFSQLQVWDYETRTKIWDLPQDEPKKSTYAVMVTPDGKKILAGGEDKTVRCWSLETGLLEWKTQLDAIVFGLILSPDGGSVVVVDNRAGASETTSLIRKLKLDDGSVQGRWTLPLSATTNWFLLPHENVLRLLTLKNDFPTSRAIVQNLTPSGSLLQSVWNRLFSHRDVELIQGFDGQLQGMWVVEGKYAQPRIAVVTSEGSLLLHDANLSNPQVLLSKKLAPHVLREVDVAEPTRDGLRFIARGTDQRLAVWSTLDGTRISELPVHADEDLGLLLSIEFSSDSTRLAIAYEKDVLVFDLSDPESPVLAERLGSPPPQVQTLDQRLLMTFSEDGKFLIFASYTRGNLLFWRWIDHQR